jgi:uncharacterized protein
MRALTSGPRVATFEIERARTKGERMRGLLGRDLAPGTAMLFERCRSIHTFGMRRPITVAFLDEGLRVIRVARVPPARMLLCRRARHAIECHIGALIGVGDVVADTRKGQRDPPRYTLAAAPLWP